MTSSLSRSDSHTGSKFTLFGVPVSSPLHRLGCADADSQLEKEATGEHCQWSPPNAGHGDSRSNHDGSERGRKLTVETLERLYSSRGQGVNRTATTGSGSTVMRMSPCQPQPEFRSITTHLAGEGMPVVPQGGTSMVLGKQHPHGMAHRIQCVGSSSASEAEANMIADIHRLLQQQVHYQLMMTMRHPKRQRSLRPDPGQLVERYRADVAESDTWQAQINCHIAPSVQGYVQLLISYEMMRDGGARLGEGGWWGVCHTVSGRRDWSYQ